MLKLFTEFKATTAEEWKAQVIKDLKGEAFESLIWKNENGFDIQPFYTAENLHQQYEPAFTHADWEICIQGNETDRKGLNGHLLKHLQSGASAISVDFEDVDPVIDLKDVGLTYIKSTFRIKTGDLPVLESYFKKTADLNKLSTTLFLKKLDKGADLENWIQASSHLNAYPDIRTACFDALPFHSFNCSAFFEVAIIMAGLTEYLNCFAQQGSFPSSAFVVRTAVNSDHFMQIAKLRAIRRLWKLLRAEYNITNDLYLIVETSMTNKSISDDHNNLVRTTIEAMAAVAGGCNELIVTEFDMFSSFSATMSERLAVNQQLILKHESYFDKMADIACGSYYIESITDALAEKALEAFKYIESEGGYFECLERKVLHETIWTQAAVKEKAVKDKSQIVVGVNKFRNEKVQLDLRPEQIEDIQRFKVFNPVLKFELENYYK